MDVVDTVGHGSNKKTFFKQSNSFHSVIAEGKKNS